MPTVHVLALLGLALVALHAAFGIRLIVRAGQLRRLKARCVPTPAVVTAVGTRNVRSMDDGPDVVLQTVRVRYVDVHGQARESTVAEARSWGRVQVGQQLVVLQDPQDPATVLRPGGGLSGFVGCFFLTLDVPLVAVILILFLLT